VPNQARGYGIYTCIYVQAFNSSILYLHFMLELKSFTFNSTMWNFLLHFVFEIVAPRWRRGEGTLDGPYISHWAYVQGAFQKYARELWLWLTNSRRCIDEIFILLLLLFLKRPKVSMWLCLIFVNCGKAM
jgi:hypothetical protein